MAQVPKFLLEHFQNPQNVGEILNPDGVGTACNASCGDITQIFIKCKADKISQVAFKAFGCGAAIATSSILTEKIKGAAIEEAIQITEQISEEILPQLPQEKVPCFRMAANALKLAIEEYKTKRCQLSSKGDFERE